MNNLPNDITSNILSRIPIRSVVQCRCVCKTWCSLISHPQFANMHFRRVNHVNPNIILNRRSVRSDLYFLEDNNEEFEEPIIRASRICVPFIESPFDLVGSCNGLLCLSPTGNQNRPIYIFNPATGQHMNLPELTIPTCVYSKSLLGFGFNVSTQEFKVIKVLFYKESSESQGFESVVQVYTLGSNSWRMIGNAPDTLSGQDCSLTFFNGSLHWMMIGPVVPDGNNTIFSRMAIVSFDLSVEAFGVVPKPELQLVLHHRQRSISTCVQLGVLGGCLSLVDCSSDSSIDVWIMRSYNVKESWIKQFSIRQRLPSWLRSGLDMPVCLRKNGEILILYDSRDLVSYNAESGQLGSLQIEIQKLLDLEAGSPSQFKAFPHVGSLIFPNQPLG